MARIPTTYRVTKDGKLAKRPARKSVSQRIAEKKNPKRRYVASGKVS